MHLSKLATDRGLRSLDQQQTHKTAALFADPAQPPPFATGIFRRIQSQIAHQLRAALEALDRTDGQHKG